LLQFDGYYPGDIAAYKKQTGLPQVPLQVILLNGFDGTPTTGPNSGNGEVALDIEMAVSMAPNLDRIVLYEAGPNGTGNEVLNLMVTNTAIKQFSSSWGFPPLSNADRATMDNYFMQMGAQGQTFFCASGDIGAVGGLIEPPCDDPYITRVGGTALGTSSPGGPWLSETVWNVQEGPGVNTSSGGISGRYPIPSWQQGVNMSDNRGSTKMRNIPDVAAAADNIFLVADNGQLETSGGTSAAAPLWAGFIALANQAAANTGLPSVGFINPALYQLGANASSAAVFDGSSTFLMGKK